ncbi:MAG: iron dicitrate transport regulator FecR [Isosphaera sp.]|nr:iron dicitrate transport regulator FecR [Isosphaera sp.]
MTDDLRALCDAAVEGTLTPADAARLEAVCRADPAARRYLVEHLNLHAALVWAAADPRTLAREGEAPAEPRAHPARREPRPPRRLAWAGWAVAAGLLVAAGVFAFTRTGPAPPTDFAKLTDAGGCTWQSGTLPTADGSRLGAGRLRLAEGVARIVFDNGAELRLEGPADLELLAGDRCRLRAGRLVARCPEAAHGFVVETPTAAVRDFGTEFGVSVGDDRADVQVFSGRVDVTHGAGRVEELVTGRGMRFTADRADALDPRAEGPQPAPPPPTLRPGQRLVTITTAAGRGKDTYVAGRWGTTHRSDVLILVKSTVAAHADYNRKGYAGFDLAPVAGLRVVDAQLSFTQTPTGWGFASEVPDATFSVYGLTDERLNDWPENGLRWENAPANAPGGAAVDPAKTVKVGEFRVPQGAQTGVWSVGGPDLAAFLNGRAAPFATFILVRDTPGSGRNDYVHGFAGRDHPTLPPPALKLVVEGR